jgi:hypothetical protein
LTKEKPEPLTVGLAIAGPDVHFISFSFAVHQQFPGRKFFDELLYLFCTLVLLSADVWTEQYKFPRHRQALSLVAIYGNIKLVHLQRKLA